jgi:peptidoglycan/LPS O-acetylase OafA/YrhL
VLMVVAYHAGLPVPGGFTGVDVFFVISGFVITEMLRREWFSTGRIALGEFIRRRVRRLLPALSTVVVATVALSSLIVTPLLQPARTALTGLGGLLLGSNVVIAVTTGDYFDEPAESNPLLHLWSLSVEEQFYLVLPVLLLVVWRRSDLKALPVVIVAMLSSFALMIFGPTLAAVSGLPELLFGFYSPVVRAWEFLFGVILALTFRWRDLPSRLGNVLGALGVGLLLVSAFAITPDVRFPGPVAVAPTLGTVLVIVATETRTGWLHGFLSRRASVAIGDRSYALYLWHWPVIVLAGTMLGGAPWVARAAALVSIVPTVLSHQWIEEPVRRRSEAPMMPLLVRGLLVPVVVVSGFAFGANNSWFQPTLADAALQLDQRSVSQASGCHGLSDLGRTRYERCWFGDGDGTPIVLLGDSNASTAADAVVPAGELLGRPVFVASGPACPFALPSDARHGQDCADFVDELLGWLASQPASDVVIVNSDTHWFPRGSATASDQAYADELRAAALSIIASGHRPVLVQPIPMFNGLADGVVSDRWRLTDCALITFLRGGCGQEFLLDDTWPQRPIWQATAGIASDLDLPLVDATERICPGGRCRTDIDGAWIYRDGTHLSARTASGLTELFVTALKAPPSP